MQHLSTDFLLLFFSMAVSTSAASMLIADSNGDKEIGWEESKLELRPCEVAASAALNWYDKAHLQLSESVCNQAVWFDNFFSPDALDTEIATSLIKIKLQQRWHEEEGYSAKPRISAYLDLPNTKKKLKLYIESQFSHQDNDSVDDEQLVLPSNEKGTAAAVRWLPWDSQDWDMAFDAGARLDGGPNLFTRALAHYSYPLSEKAVAKFSQELLLELQDSWSETTRFYIDSFKGKRGYRWYTRAKYGDQTDGLEWDVYAGTITKLDERSTLSLYASVKGATDDQADEQSESYRLGIYYRHSFFRPWLFYEFEPQLTWPRHYDYELTPVVLLKLEIQIGRRK